MLDYFFEIGKSLDFIQQWCVGGRELEQLNANAVAAMAKSDGEKRRFARRHVGEVAGWMRWSVESEMVVEEGTKRIGAM